MTLDCRSARRLSLASELGPLSPAAGAALARHLAHCADCVTELAAERRLVAELARLHVEPPFAVDVSAAVKRRVAALGPVGRGVGIGRRLLVAAAMAGASLGLFLVLARAGRPELEVALGQLGGLPGSLASLAAGLVALGSSAAASLARLGHRLFDGAHDAFARVEPLEPVAMGGILACTVLMVLTITLVVGRDIARRRTVPEETR